MRLIRLRIADFHPGQELVLEFGKPSKDRMNLAFLVGPNGSGKSRVLEALGRISSHLDAGLPVGLDFDLEYELGPRRILITTQFPELADAPKQAPPPLERINAWVLVDDENTGRWRSDHVSTEWAASSLGRLLPSHVIGLSNGPASRLDWALRGAVADSLAQRQESEAEQPAAGVSPAEWESYTEAEKLQAARERRLAGSWSRCVALSGEELALAVLTILCHPSDLGAGTEIRDDLLKRVGLDAKSSLLAFTFEVSAQKRAELLPDSRDKFDALLSQSVRRVKLAAQTDPEAEEEAERDERIVFEVTPKLRSWVSGSADTPFIWFRQLLRWLKAGALRSVRMVLRKKGSRDLLLDSDFSDGEFLLVGRYGLLLLLREHENCLVLFDEPETHFNDQWKVHLVYDLARIFDSTPAQVVIATHSDITLSDADREAVSILDPARQADGPVTRGRRPPLSPLGAERSGISAAVFGIDPAMGKKAMEEIDEAITSRDRVAIEETLERVGPGYQQFRLHQALREARGDAG